MLNGSSVCMLMSELTIDCREDYDAKGTGCIPKPNESMYTVIVIVIIIALVLILFALSGCVYYWRYSARARMIRCAKIVQHYSDLEHSSPIGNLSNQGGESRHDSTLEMTALTSKLFDAPEELGEVSRKRNLFRSAPKLTMGTNVAQPDHDTLAAARIPCDTLHEGQIDAGERQSGITVAQHEELRAYLTKRTMRRQYTPLHCAAVCDAELHVVRSVVQIAPAAVAMQDSHGLDAVQVAVNHAADKELVATMVVGCLQAGGVELDGWHTILERSDCGEYVAAVVSLVQRGVAAKEQSSDQHPGKPTPLALRCGRSRQFAHRPPPIALQVTSASIEAVEELAYVLDSRHRKGIDVAAQDNKSILETAILYRKRYGPLRSNSRCCLLRVRNRVACYGFCSGTRRLRVESCTNH